MLHLFKKALTSSSSPVDMPDDGFRVAQRGYTKSGKYPYVGLDNPTHTALAVAARRRWEITRASGVRAFS